MDESQRPRNAAMRALDRLGMRHEADAPTRVDVARLADELGLDVETFHPATRRPGTLGWLEPGEPLIFVREGLAESSRRFTLAHEIGHFLLHRGERNASGDEETGEAFAECDVGDLDAPVDAVSVASETLRPGQAYSARARRESEANQFASYLLLPAPSLLASYRRLVAGQGQTRSAADLRSLADQYGVSEDVLLRRLTALLVQAPVELADEAMARVDTPREAPALDPDQRAAAHSSTPALVIAGPGTGKTSTLVARVAHLALDQRLPPESILALTFSNKAAGEMRERIRALLAPSDAELDALMSSRRLPLISTIHAFCGDLLRRYAPLVGLRPDYRLVTEAEGYFLLRDMSRALELPHYVPLAAPAQHFPALLSAISRAKDELCGPEEYAGAAAEMAERATTPEEREAAEKAREVARAYAAYQEALRARGDADFGDLIMLTVRLLRERPDVRDELRQAHRQILVDEFQDINRAMGILLNTLAGADGALWAVGDADQAIYRFRGASPANLAQFTTDYPTAAVHTLRRNYRSLAPVLEGAAGVARAFLDEGERPALMADRGGARQRVVTLATADSEDAELAGVAEVIRRHVADGRRLSDQVVLCRTRRQCQRVAAALAGCNIPTLLSAALFDQDDAKDLLAVAALLADSSGAGLLRVGRTSRYGFTRGDADVILTEARNRSAPVVTVLSGALDGIAELTDSGRLGLARLGRALQELRRAPDVATGLTRYVFGQTTTGFELLALDGAGDADQRESASRVAQILALARAYDDQRRGERPFASAADWIGFLDFVRVVAALRQEGGSGTAELTLEDGVRVMTVHASKGLEFPVVYLPGLADRRFPMQRQWEPAPLPSPLRERGGQGDPREVHLAEEACLFYVALTRARDELILSHAERYGNMRYQPSPFLGPIRDALGPDLRLMKWSAPITAGQTTKPPRAVASVAARTETDIPSEDVSQPLTISALETYARCPKQYAYRYVHGLRPREIGLSTLRRSLHTTLNDLHARYTEQRTVGTSASPSLDEALALFENAWRGAVRGDAGRESDSAATGEHTTLAPGADSSDSLEHSEGPFDDVYRRHGRDIVTRVWSSLVAPAPVEQQEGGADNRQAFDQTVVVHVGQRDIAVKLDRVDVPRTRERARIGSRTSSSQQRGLSEPARVVRHKLGLSADRSPDLRALLYRLAAEQTPGGRPDLYQQNLTTGEVQPMEIDQRRFAKLRDDLDELISGIERGDFSPRPSPNTCNACPFLFVCPT
ncbi:MAG TPA: ATP-dependent helicase [Ktedonobacterales bacterium]